MPKDGKDYYIQSHISGLLGKSFRAGMVTPRSDFWSAMQKAVECGKQFRIETLPIGKGSGGLSFLLIWDFSIKFAVYSKPQLGVIYLPYSIRS